MKLGPVFAPTSPMMHQAPDPPAAAPAAAPAASAAAAAAAPAARAVADPAAEILRLQGEVANTRAEAAAYRIDARTANEAVATANARITELQAEAERRVQEANNSSNSRVTILQGRTIEAELKAAAIAAGLTDADLLPLIDKTGIKFEGDNITGIPEAIAKFKTAKPTYFRDAPPPAPAAAAPAARSTTGAPAAPAAASGAPAPASVMTIPKTPEGRVEYESKKRDALRSLRG